MNASKSLVSTRGNTIFNFKCMHSFPDLASGLNNERYLSSINIVIEQATFCVVIWIPRKILRHLGLWISKIGPFLAKILSNLYFFNFGANLCDGIAGSWARNTQIYAANFSFWLKIMDWWAKKMLTPTGATWRNFSKNFSKSLT